MEYFPELTRVAQRWVVACVAFSLLMMPMGQPWAQGRTAQGVQTGIGAASQGLGVIQAGQSLMGGTRAAATAPAVARATGAAATPSAASLAAADTQIRANGIEGVPSAYSGLSQTLQDIMPYAAAAGLALSAFMLIRCLGKKNGQRRCSGTGIAVAAMGAVLSAGALVGSLTWNNRLNAAEMEMGRTLDQGMNGSTAEPTNQFRQTGAVAGAAAGAAGAAARPGGGASLPLPPPNITEEQVLRQNAMTEGMEQGVRAIQRGTYSGVPDESAYRNQTFSDVVTPAAAVTEPESTVRLTRETGFNLRSDVRAARNGAEDLLDNNYNVGREIRDRFSINSPVPGNGADEFGGAQTGNRNSFVTRAEASNALNAEINYYEAEGRENIYLNHDNAASLARDLEARGLNAADAAAAEAPAPGRGSDHIGGSQSLSGRINVNDVCPQGVAGSQCDRNLRGLPEISGGPLRAPQAGLPLEQPAGAAPAVRLLSPRQLQVLCLRSPSDARCNQ